MVAKEQLYVARLVGWLNFRYYVIELHNRTYIIDYANPRDIRNYFPGFFPKHNRQYMIYDITDTKGQYAIKTVPWWQSPNHRLIELWSAVSWLVGVAILSFLGINFVHNDNVLIFWKFVLLIGVISISLIIFSLNRISETPSQLFQEKSYKIERKPQLRYVSKKRKAKTGPVGDFFQQLIGLPASLIFMLNKNYLIMLLGFIAAYSILFIRFINIFDMLSMNKFIFLEEEN